MTLKQKLEYRYKEFNRSSISPDPLQFLHLFGDRNNIELMGFIAAVFAYGNVKQIIASLNEILRITGGDPYRFISAYKNQEINLVHRFYTSDDVTTLFTVLKHIYNRCGSIENLYMRSYSKEDISIKNSLEIFSSSLLEEVKLFNGVRGITEGVKFMFPRPSSGSACKRLNLFLRWMVRKDELDFGLWRGIRTNQLIIPVDTHIASIARRLNLTQKKNISWSMAEEITGRLKKYDPDDPVKYDFALCHIGMRGLKL